MSVEPLYFSFQPGNRDTIIEHAPPNADFALYVKMRAKRLEDSRIEGYALALDTQGWKRKASEKLTTFDDELRRHFKGCGFEDFVSGKTKFIPEELLGFDHFGPYFREAKTFILSKVLHSTLGLDINGEEERFYVSKFDFVNLPQYLKQSLIKQEAIRLIAYNTQNALETVSLDQECVAYNGGVDKQRTNGLLTYLASEFGLEADDFIDDFWAQESKTIGDLIDLISKKVGNH